MMGRPLAARTRRGGVRAFTAQIVGALFVSVITSYALTPTGPAGAAPKDPAATVELLDRGRAPRTPLRWIVPPPGTTRALTLRMNLTTNDSLSGRTGPLSLVMTGESTIVGPGPAETTTVSATVVRAHALGNPTIDDELNSADLVGWGWESDITSSGRVVATRTGALEGLDPTAAGVVNSLVPQLQGLTKPFPTEPVGSGARWRATEDVQVSGVSVTNRTEFRLVRRVGNEVELAVRSVQTAKPGPFDIPGLPADAHAAITTWHGTGTGSQILDLAKPFDALRSKMHLRSLQRFRVTQGKKSRAASVALDLALAGVSTARLPTSADDLFIALPEGFSYGEALDDAALNALSVEAGRGVQGPAGQSASVMVATCVDPTVNACVDRSSPLFPVEIEGQKAYRYRLGDRSGMVWKPNDYELIVLSEDPAFAKDLLSVFVRGFA